MIKIALFISGRGSNMKAILEQCKNGILSDIAKPVLVFSNKKDAVGLDYATMHEIPTISVESKGLKRKDFDQKVLALLEPYNPDYIVLAGYMRILSPILIQAYPKRIINIHPADTHLHQGLDGYKWAFEKKLPKTKVTVHYVDEGLDTGSIIEQAEVDLTGVKTLEEIESRGLKVEHQLYSQVLKKILIQS
jgi:phosphoribosylglycinamide formyltransferase-1